MMAQRSNKRVAPHVMANGGTDLCGYLVLQQSKQVVNMYCGQINARQHYDRNHRAPAQTLFVYKTCPSSIQ